MNMLTTKPKRMTAEVLEDLGACVSETETFRKLWPKGAAITVRNLVLLRKQPLDFEWFLQRLPRRMRCAYERGVDASFNAWDKETDKLAAKRGKMGKLMSKKAYDKAYQAIDAKYDRREARAFVLLWNAWNPKPRKRRK